MFFIIISIFIVFSLIEYLRQIEQIEKRYRLRMRMINREWHGVDCNIPEEPMFFGMGRQDDIYYLPERILFLRNKVEAKNKREAWAKKLVDQKLLEIQSNHKDSSK